MDVDETIQSASDIKSFQIFKPNSKEKIFENRFQNTEKKLGSILSQKIQKSLLGVVLTLPETLSSEDRDGIWELLKMDLSKSPRPNDDLLCTDMIDLIEQALISTPILNRSTVFKLITNLRLMDCGIEEMDDSLTGMNNLKLLNLSGNWIKDITGTQLPRNLGILEMFSNELSSVGSLAKDLPDSLIHLGLARNHLSDESELQLLAKNGTSMLRSLDLADNNFVDLLQLLRDLSSIPHLLALQLEGNPCSMCYLYREAVISKLPRLRYLDSICIAEEDRREEIDELALTEGTENGAVCFNCYRIMGVEQPDRNDVWMKQKIIQKYHVEIDSPLFPQKPAEDFQEGNEEEQEEISSATSHKRLAALHKTPPIPWSKVMEFPAPCIRVATSEIFSLKDLRDVFRSYVTIRFIHTRSVAPEPPKKGEQIPEVPPEDIILSETILAEFKASLETLNWAVESIDYSWEKSDEFSDNAKPLQGCAKVLNYKEPGTKKSAKSRSISLAIPNILTFYIGFGLQRTLPDPEKDLIIVPMTPRKSADRGRPKPKNKAK